MIAYFVVRVVILVLDTEVIPEVRIPNRLVDVVAPYYTRELEYFARQRHFRLQFCVVSQ